MIRFSCPVCGHAIKAPDDAAGKTGKCKCGEQVRVPSPQSSVTVKKPSSPRPIPAPRSDPAALPELPEWLARDYPNARWSDTRQHEGDRGTSSNQLETANRPPSSAAVGEPLPQHPNPSPEHYTRAGTRSGAVGIPLSQHPDAATPRSPTPNCPLPTGEMILCYACRKPLADTAFTCPKCGATLTPEGREKGRQMKKQKQRFDLVVTLVISVPIFFCCFSGIISNSHNTGPSPGQRVPAGWDMDKLKRDADDVSRDPSKTIFIPKDGSQPFIVPNPFPDPGP